MQLGRQSLLALGEVTSRDRMLCEERNVSSPVLPLLLQVLGNRLISVQLLLPHLLKYDLQLYNGGFMPAKDVKSPGHIRCYLVLGGLVLVAESCCGNYEECLFQYASGH